MVCPAFFAIFCLKYEKNALKSKGERCIFYLCCIASCPYGQLLAYLIFYDIIDVVYVKKGFCIRIKTIG